MLSYAELYSYTKDLHQVERGHCHYAELMYVYVKNMSSVVCYVRYMGFCSEQSCNDYILRRGQCGQRPNSIGRVLYVERLIAGSTAAARKCLLITRKIIIPPPGSGDPPDGPPVFYENNRFP